MEDAAIKKAHVQTNLNKEAEAKRQEDLSNHLNKPLVVLPQAGLRFIQDQPNFRKNGQVIHIKPHY